MSPSGRRQRMTLLRGGASMGGRCVPTGTLPSSPTRWRFRWLQTQAHLGSGFGGRLSGVALIRVGQLHRLLHNALNRLSQLPNLRPVLFIGGRHHQTQQMFQGIR